MVAKTVLRMGRVTRHLPWLRGVSLISDFYRGIRPMKYQWLVRVNDFDHDLKIEVDPREFIGANIWHKTELYEKDERTLFCSAIHPGSVVLDVGANVGIYTLLAAKRNARVFAIEADPKNAASLRKNIDFNGFGRTVEVHEMAATEVETDLKIYRNPKNCGGSSLFTGVDGVTVHGKRIDSLDLPPINVCKMDIEGAEVFALRGMAETIRRSPDMTLLIEHAEEHGNTDDLVEFLWAHFKTIRVVGGEGLQTGQHPPKHCNLWASQPYV